MILRTNLIRLASIAVIALAVIFGVTSTAPPTASPLPEPAILQSDMTLISHAGSGLPEGAYSNSLQALEQAVANTLTYIEIDLSWTADRKLVLLHDWRQQLGIWFDLPLLYKAKRKIAGRDLPMTEAEFLALNMRSNLTQMNLNDLSDWLEAHPNIRIITDIKRENIPALASISSTFPTLVDQIVPQIYSFEEYDQARAFGYSDIVFTGYKSEASNAQIIAFASANDLLALTLPLRRLTTEGLAQFAEVETPIWTHTVNDPVFAEKLYRAGVDGLYTDVLKPIP